MSDLVEQYKALTVELTRHEQEGERLKGEREVICGKLLAQDGKGHAYDLGDGMPMVIATTKIGTHYMAPKNKWQKSGRPPKPPKAPRVPKVKAEKPPKEVKPLVRRAIVGGKLVEIPIEAKRKSDPPPSVQLPAAQPSAPEVTVKAGEQPVVVAAPPKVEVIEPEAEQVAVPDAVETFTLDEAPASAAAPEPAPVAKPAPAPAPQKELDPLEAALAELEID